MNNNRRAELTAISSQLEELKDRLETLKWAEEDYRDNMPENLRGTQKYDKADEAVGALDNAVGALEEAVNNIEEATQ